MDDQTEEPDPPGDGISESAKAADKRPAENPGCSAESVGKRAVVRVRIGFCCPPIAHATGSWGGSGEGFGRAVIRHARGRFLDGWRR